jgi:hypothetical protein
MNRGGLLAMMVSGDCIATAANEGVRYGARRSRSRTISVGMPALAVKVGRFLVCNLHFHWFANSAMSAARTAADVTGWRQVACGQFPKAAANCKNRLQLKKLPFQRIRRSGGSEVRR